MTTKTDREKAVEKIDFALQRAKDGTITFALKGLTEAQAKAVVEAAFRELCK